jgi:hypothetical protein
MRFLLETDERVVKKEYWIRLVTILFFLLGLCALIGSVLLLPSYFLTFTKQKILERTIGSLHTVEIQEYEVLGEVLVATQQKLSMMAESSGEEVSQVVADIILYKPAGISISAFMFEHHDRARLSINGIAVDRESLLAFKETLEGQEMFTSVELPVSNLAKDRDIDFSIAVEGNF